MEEVLYRAECTHLSEVSTLSSISIFKSLCVAAMEFLDVIYLLMYKVTVASQTILY